ncbi:SPOR domain-containing protein [bacterium AH-315-J21]|nr:SPOR domain-containing protein [bacterium AH-315-J21]
MILTDMISTVNKANNFQPFDKRLRKVLLGVTLVALTGFVGTGCADKEKEEAAKQEVLRLEAVRADSILQDSLVRVAQVLADSVAAAEAAIPEEPEMPAHPSLQVEWGTYTVQIASYDSRELAMPFYNKLEAEGREPYILDEVVEENGEERIIYRLRFGKYSSKDEAHNKGSEVALVNELDYWVDNYKH